MQYNLKSLNYKGNRIPPQAIPSKFKDEVWQEATVDSIENIGLAQISETRARYSDAYKIVDGTYEYKDIVNSSAFLSEVDFLRNQAELDTSIKNYGFIEPLVNQLVWEYVAKPNGLIVDANDTLSSNDYIRTKTEKLWKSVSQSLKQRIEKKLELSGLLPAPQFKSQEEQQQYQQQIAEVQKAETPSEIERDMNQNYRSIYVEWAEATLKEDVARFEMDEIKKELYSDVLKSGRCFVHWRVGYDYYYPERWNIFNTFSDLTQTKPENGDYVGHIDYMSANKVIANYGHKLTEKQKIALTNSSDYKTHLKKWSKKQGEINNLSDWIDKGGGEVSIMPHSSYFAMQNTSYIENSLGVPNSFDGWFPNGNDKLNYFDGVGGKSGRTDLIRTTEGYWVSQQRVGLLTLKNEETNQLEKEIVTDEILKAYLKEKGIKQLRDVTLEQHEAEPKENTIVWDYRPRVWEFVKISKENTELKEDIYIVEPFKYQLKGESLIYHTKLPVVGLTEESSLVSRLEEEQKDYNIARNSMREYMNKDLGVFYAMDMTYLPQWLKDYGGEDTMVELLDVIKELGILPLDGSTQNTQSRFNQFTTVNMDLTKVIVDKLSLAKMIKAEALEKMGSNPQRMGSPVSQHTATGVKQSVSASYAQTETWFDKFAKIDKRIAEMHVNFAQYMKKDGIDGTVNFVDSDKIRTFINMSDPYLSMRHFKIFHQNNSKRRGEVEMIKNIFMSDNTIDKNIESLAKVVSSDSVSQIIEAGKRGRIIAEVKQQQQALNRQKEIQLEQAGEQEKEKIKHDFKMEQLRLRGVIEVEKQKILALGFSKDKDLNKDGVPDVIAQSKIAIDRLKLTLSESNQNLNRVDAKIRAESEERHNRDVLNIKREEIKMQKYKADKTLEVARENKTKSELSRKNK